MEPVTATPLACDWIRRLQAEHGALVFFVSGGCCDGSAPMCWPKGDFRVGARDVKIGEIEGVEVWMGGDQHARWAHTRLIIDVVPGRGAGFSLEAVEGVRFLLRSELCAL